MRTASGRAFARVGLLGNPSDGYGGKTLAFALGDFRARARIEPCDRVEIIAADDDPVTFVSAREAAEAYSIEGTSGGVCLVSAALHRFFVHTPWLADLDVADERLRFSIRFDTDIPRQVGLAGSSAIVVAVMRGLMGWFDHAFEPAELAEIALAAEVEELDLAGGPMDRVIQVYEGVVVMDLREPRTAASYKAVDPDLLPPLFVAWDPAGGEPSGKAHGALRARWDSGDEELRTLMSDFRGLVDAGLEALDRGDHDAFAELMNRNFEMRARFFPISERDREAISIARRAGAAAKLCGSGGAIVGQPGDESAFDLLRSDYRAADFEFLRPRIVAAR